MAFERNPILVTVPMVISPEDIDNIICTALEGGITDWCNKAEVLVKPEEYEYEYTHEVVSRGGTIRLYVDDAGPVSLDLDNFTKGIQRFIEENIERLDIENIGASDAGEADSIIQYAVFDELVYC